MIFGLFIIQGRYYIKAKPSLHTLNLSQDSFSSMGVHRLIATLKQYYIKAKPSLHTLNLSQDSFASMGVHRFIATLKQLHRNDYINADPQIG